MTAKAVRFAVVADPADPTIVQSIEGPAAEQLAPGQRVLSVNGFPLGSLADFQRVVDATSDYAIGDSVRVAFGVEDPVTGITSVRNVVLPAVQSTMLLNGIRFETVRDGDGWATFVSEASGQEQSELQTGDRIVAHMPSNDMIDQQDALQTVLQRELEAGSTQINFAVNRNGDMWLVSMPFGPATGN
jgi:hypothetical protein